VSPDTPRAASRRGWLLAVLAVALAARVLALLPFRIVGPQFDEAYYVGVAINLATGYGHAATLDAPEPTALRGPLLPAFLALPIRLILSRSDQIAVWVLRASQIPLSLVTVWLVFELCAARFGLRAAVGSGLACALSPALAHYAHFLWAESLGALGLTAFLFFADRWDRGRRRAELLAAGVCLGLTALAKPIWVYFAAPAAVWVLAREGWRARRATAGAALLLLGAAAPVLPWTARNAWVLGKPVLISDMGWWPIAVGNLADDSLASKRALMARASDLPAAERDAFYREEALRAIAAQQPAWILVKAWRMAEGLLSARSQELRFLEQGWIQPGPAAARWLIATDALGHYALLALGLVALWLVPGGGSKPLLVLALLYLCGVHVLANAIQRYHVVALPLLLLYVGPLLAGGAARDGARWRRAGALASLALGLGIPLPASLAFLAALWERAGGG
jgi:hypothetical protein